MRHRTPCGGRRPPHTPSVAIIRKQWTSVRDNPDEGLFDTPRYPVAMSESDLPGHDSDEDETEHPLKRGVDAAAADDTASLEAILSDLD